MFKPMDNSRREQALRWRKEGHTYVEIGRRLGLTSERVRQIIKGFKVPRAAGLPEHPEALLTSGQAASLFNIHPNTLRRWSDQGKLKTYRIGGRGDRRFRRRDLDEFLKESLQ